MRTSNRPRPSTRVAGLLAAAALALTAGCTDSLTDQARSTDEATGGSGGTDGAGSAFESSVCEAVRDGIDSYNVGNLEDAVRSFDDALPLAQARADQAGSSENAPDARALLEAVRYYAGLSAEELGDAFPASPETQQFQVTTLDQCQPFGSTPEDPSEQSA